MEGESTTWLAEGAGASSGTRIFAIDSHEPYLADPQADSLRDLRANLERLGLTARVMPMVARSEAATVSFDQPIDLLFIDGDHEAGPVAADVALWLPKVRAGGWAAPRRPEPAMAGRQPGVEPAALDIDDGGRCPVCRLYCRD